MRPTDCCTILYWKELPSRLSTSRLEVLRAALKLAIKKCRLSFPRKQDCIDSSVRLLLEASVADSASTPEVCTPPNGQRLVSASSVPRQCLHARVCTHLKKQKQKQKQPDMQTETETETETARHGNRQKQKQK
eukprot:5354788-Pyramimonas_sp.AAC.1